MCDTKALSIREHFESLPDPRIDRQKRHNLIDIVTITICAVILWRRGVDPCRNVW